MIWSEPENATQKRSDELITPWNIRKLFSMQHNQEIEIISANNHAKGSNFVQILIQEDQVDCQNIKIKFPRIIILRGECELAQHLAFCLMRGGGEDLNLRRDEVLLRLSEWSADLFLFILLKSSSNVIVLALAGQIKWIYLYQIKVYDHKLYDWTPHLTHSIHCSSVFFSKSLNSPRLMFASASFTI